MKWSVRVCSAHVVLLVLTLAGGLGAQQQAPPMFRSAIALVTVDVSVLDADGKPVPGLTAGDFEVKLNGRVRPVKVLTYVQAAGELAPNAPAVKPAMAQVAPGARQGTQVSTNEGVVAAAKAQGEDRVFVLLIDDLSFEPMRGRALFQAAQSFVDGLPPVDLVGIATTSGTASVNPTADRARIADVLEKAAGWASNPQSLTPMGATAAESANPDADGSVSVYQAIEIDAGNFEQLKAAIARACFNGDRSQVDAQVLDVLIATDNCASQVNRQARSIASRTRQNLRSQVSSFVAVIDAMRAASGLRHLVVLSDGLAVGRQADQLTPVARAAAAAGVQVSLLMEERDLNITDVGRHVLMPPAGGTAAPPPQSDTGAPQRRIEDNKMYLAGGQLVAEMAGGQFHRVVGDPEPFFARVRAASAAVYRLGIEPSPDLDPSRITSVEATVKRRGLLVHANRHGVAPALASLAAAEPTLEDRLKAAIGNGQSHGAVPLRIATSLRRTSGAATLDLHVSAEAPEAVTGPLIAMFGLLKDGEQLGTITTGRREIAAPAGGGPFRLSVLLPVTDGSYRLRVAMADAVGALGAIEVPVDVVLNSIGPLVASDLMTAWVDAKGQPHLFALEDLPSTATSLQTVLELYAPAGAAAGAIESLIRDVQVELTLTKLGEADPIDDRHVVPQVAAGVARVVAEFPTDDLTPGTYRLRATVRIGEETAGAVIATVRKR